MSRTFPREAVLHATWNVDPVQPWVGIGPMAAAAYGAKLAGNVEAKLVEETGAPSALLIPVPTDGGDDSLDSLRADIRAAKGSAVVVEGTASGWDEGQTKGTRNDWRAETARPDDPAAAPGAVRGYVRGRPGGLRDPGRARDRRRGRHVTKGKLPPLDHGISVEPVAELIAEEASEKLDSQVDFDFRGLWAHDLAGRASAYVKLRAAEMSDADAKAATGLLA